MNGFRASRTTSLVRISGEGRQVQVPIGVGTPLAKYGRYEFTKTSEPINMEEIVEALAHHPILSIMDEGDA